MAAEDDWSGRRSMPLFQEVRAQYNQEKLIVKPSLMRIMTVARLEILFKQLPLSVKEAVDRCYKNSRGRCYRRCNKNGFLAIMSAACATKALPVED